MDELIKNHNKTVGIFTIGAIFVVIIGILATIYSKFYIVTNDTYIQLDKTPIISNVPGQVTELYVDDNSSVKKGEILVQLDPEDYKIQLDKAVQQLEEAKTKLKISKDKIEQINKSTKQTENALESAKLNLENANSDYFRYKNAYKDGSVTKKDLDNATKNLEIARSQLQEAQENLNSANDELKSNITTKTSQDNEIKKLMSQVDEARLNLSYTTITAPFDGIVINRNIDINSEVTTQDPIFSIVHNNFYIIANFSHHQIANIKPGQQAIVKINTLKNKKFKGMVQSTNPVVKIKFNTDELSDYVIPANAKALVKIKI